MIKRSLKKYNRETMRNGIASSPVYYTIISFLIFKSPRFQG